MFSVHVFEEFCFVIPTVASRCTPPMLYKEDAVLPIISRVSVFMLSQLTSKRPTSCYFVPLTACRHLVRYSFFLPNLYFLLCFFSVFTWLLPNYSYISLPKMKYQCIECETSYSTISNLRKHANKFHPNDVTKLAPLRYNKSSPNSNIRCSICSKTFIHKKTLRKHAKVHGLSDLHLQSQSKTVKDFKKCALCQYKGSYKADLLKHYENIHEIPMHWHNLTFSSLDDFNQWKMETEDENSSKFVKIKAVSYKSHKSIQYACHRSGTYFPRGKGLRHLKKQGSNKINAYCPAHIQVFIENDEKLRVKYLQTHVGHELDMSHLQLTEIERKNIAAKIAAKLPFEAILDEIRDSIITDNSLKRIHLTTKKDLFNIKSSLNLCSSSLLHSSDDNSVESWVIEMQRVGEHILFFKPQGDILEEHPQLRKEDFVLIIMTPTQIEMLKKFGSDCICLDGTYGVKSRNFELHTLLIIDDLKKGFPCAFLFSNRADTEVISLFLNQIAEQVGIITPKTFMSDLTEIYFNTWLQVMGIPENRLFCTWHIDRAWRKNLAKIKNQEKKVIMYKQLSTLLQERDPIVFEKMLEQYCNIFDEETLDFINYFKENYQKNSKYWAYCYRLHSGLNTNTRLERMHRTIKYIYLAGKKERLDKAISALMRFVRDKLIDRLIVMKKGKISSELKNICDRHESREQIDPSLIVPTEHGWEIPSATTNEIYLIQEGNNSCKCQLRCSECNICIHRYYCTCQDSSIKLNLCKHIHLLAEFRKKNENINNDVLVGDLPEVYELYYDSDSDENDDSNVIITQLSNKQKTESSIEERQQNLSKQFHEILASGNTHEKLDAIEKALNSLPPTLAAIDHHSTNEQMFPPPLLFWSIKK